MKINKNIIVYDIETSFNLQGMWSIYQDGASIDTIIQERYIICACWKYLGDSKVHTITPRKIDLKKAVDGSVCKQLYTALKDAQLLVAHNGDRFDMRHVNARMLINGQPLLPNIKTYDTLKVARRKFAFNSNKLDYLGRVLGLGQKLETGGFGLWKDIVLNHDMKALKRMVDYNIQDVKLLEDVYLALRPYDESHPNTVLFDNPESDALACNICGSERLTKHGTRANKNAVYQRWHCKDCGSYPRSRKAFKNKSPLTA